MDRSFLILYELGKRMRSKGDKLLISSSDLGNYLGISQQSASRYLTRLEKRGFIERSRKGKGQVVRFTEKGINLLEEVYLNLRDFIEEGGKPMLIEGKVISGLGEGAYYVREYADRLQRSIGFKPFFGTLNIKPQRAYPSIDKYIAGTIRGFKKGDRTFGEIGYMPVKLMGDEWEEDCYLVIPQRKHYIDEFEIVSREKLREKYKIKDGDVLKIEIKP